MSELTEEIILRLGGRKDEEKIFSYLEVDREADLRLYLLPEGQGIVLTYGMNAPLSKHKNINTVAHLKKFYFKRTGTNLTYR